MKKRGTGELLTASKWIGSSLAATLCFLPTYVLASGAGMPIESPFALLMRVINFALLVALLFFLLRKPMSNFVNGRHQKVREDLEEAQRAREEAEAHYKEMEQKLAEAQKEMTELKQMLIDQGKAEKEKILANAQREGERIRQQSEITAQQEIKKAQHLLRQEAVELAASMAETMLKERIQPKDHEILIDDYLEKLEKGA
jgi:F-type H+-transporting ATPase subunit b